jgi:hypothetical protein
MSDKIRYKITIIGMAQTKKMGILINETSSKRKRYWLSFQAKVLNLSAINGNSTTISIENNRVTALKV